MNADNQFLFNWYLNELDSLLYCELFDLKRQSRRKHSIKKQYNLLLFAVCTKVRVKIHWAKTWDRWKAHCRAHLVYNK